MRYIAKPQQPPESIRDYLANQTPVGHGLDYRTFSQTASPNGGSRGRQLCEELTREQFGLCAYTGAGIDSRMGTLANPAKEIMFSRHNEHLKPQSVCRSELTRAGGMVGIDVGEDLDHRNIVAALLVSGGRDRVARRDLFGAAYRGNCPVPILPIDPSCETRFTFDNQGAISATHSMDGHAADTIGALNLNHAALRGWREQAIRAFVEGIDTRADAERVIDGTTNPSNGQLPEYCFAIRQVVQSLLGPT